VRGYQFQGFSIERKGKKIVHVLVVVSGPGQVAGDKKRIEPVNETTDSFQVVAIDSACASN
jgi:hypothetical protein